MSLTNKSLSKYPTPNPDRSTSPRSKITATATSQSQSSTHSKPAQFLMKQEPFLAAPSSPLELEAITELSHAVDFLPDLLKVLATSSTESSQSSLTHKTSSEFLTSNLSASYPKSLQATGASPLPSSGAVEELRERLRTARDQLNDGSRVISPLESNITTDQRVFITLSIFI